MHILGKTKGQIIKENLQDTLVRLGLLNHIHKVMEFGFELSEEEKAKNMSSKKIRALALQTIFEDIR